MNYIMTKMSKCYKPWETEETLKDEVADNHFIDFFYIHKRRLDMSKLSRSRDYRSRGDALRFYHKVRFDISLNIHPIVATEDMR